ncbi:MAG TPA: hypothetical protein PKN08_01250 [Opitutaceae bacterium]|nr:hypothetical protein [Opitutaceae bacterium]
MSDTTTKKSGLLSKIESREDAARTIKEGAIGFIFIGVLHIVIGMWLLPGVIADGVFYAVIAGFLWRWKSRIAAVLLAMVAVPNVVVTLLNRIGVTNLGGGNVFLAVIVAVVSVRVVEATFKIHGRFRSQEGGPNRVAGGS